MKNHITVLGRIVTVLSVVGCMLAGAVLSAPAWAAGFPEKGKVIRLIASTAAGGSNDVGARILASGMEKVLGTSVVVENKPGANQQIGHTVLAQSKPDGYTIGVTNIPITPALYLDPVRKAVFTRKSFQPLALFVIDPTQITVKADSPFKSLKDVIDAAKAAPNKVTITTTGIGSDEHFGLIKLQRAAGIKFAMVHFSDGSAPAMTAVLGGKIDVLCCGVGNALAQFKSGDLRLLGIFDNKESPFHPGSANKTLEAQGYKLYNASARGISAPAGVPKEIANILAEAIEKVFATEDFQKSMANMGLTTRFMNAAQYSAYWDEADKSLVELLPATRE